MDKGHDMFDGKPPTLQEAEDAAKEALFDQNRKSIFTVHEAKGEYIWGMYVGDWLKDPESDTELRYCLAGKRTQDFRIEYVLFAQIRSEGFCMILDEGICIDSQFKKKWKRFLADAKKEIGVEFKYVKHDFYLMDPDRRDMLFNAIVTEER